ncbi:MAG: hypothetical protein KatS3mg017_0774 [Fimbriimonadales bacterium]|nr:MAG: hypothetical protein KatS3mg017_0774 [Fimbriimonadales bacterium]
MYQNPLHEAIEEAKKVKVLYEVNTGYTLTAKLERFFGVAMTIAVLNLVFLAWRPEWGLWSSTVALFLIGAWLPVSYLGERLEDLGAYRDLLILGLLQAGLGNPIAAFVLYGMFFILAWLITRGELSSAAIPFALAYVGFRCLFDLALLFTGTLDLADWLRFQMDPMRALPLLAMAVGWFVGSLLRND